MNTNYVVQTSDKSKKTALILCICLGMFGAHYFYVGRFGKGLVYLCTMGWLCFGWIIDIFTVLGGNFKDAAGVPLRK